MFRPIVAGPEGCAVRRTRPTIPVPMVRRLVLLVFLAALFAGTASSLAQPDVPGPVVVADVRGPLDQRAIDFLVDTVRTPDAQMVVIKIDNPGIASGDPTELFATVAEATIPVVAWIGPAGAEAYGGVAELALRVDVAGAAPGAKVGYLTPTVAGEDTGLNIIDGTDLDIGLPLFDSAVEITEQGPNPEFISIVSPTIGQFIVALDGTDVGGVEVETAEVISNEGVEVTVSSVNVRFVKPDLFTRFLRLSIRPEATFFFLVAGLALAAFEFYAAGAGMAAAVAAISLFLAGYGMATLPINWLAIAATVAGLILYTWDFQRNELGLRSILGTMLLVGGGLAITDAAPQFSARWWAVLLTVGGLALFYLFAMTSIVRSRFSTPTIGREYLVGRTGVAETGFDPEGVVTVDGARWRARSHRAAGLGPGDAVEVVEVKGIVLEVGPPNPESVVRE